MCGAYCLRAGYDATYEAVARDDTDSARAKSKAEQRWAYVMRKFWAVVWVGFALFIAKVVDLWHVVTEDYVTGRPQFRLHRGYFKLGIICFALWVAVATYLVVWVKYVLKVEQEWEEYAPRSIPFATCCGVVGIVSFIVAFWPVWGLLTLPICFVLFMGLLHSAHFVPL